MSFNMYDHLSAKSVSSLMGAAIKGIVKKLVYDALQDKGLSCPKIVNFIRDYQPEAAITQQIMKETNIRPDTAQTDIVEICEPFVQHWKESLEPIR